MNTISALQSGLLLLNYQKTYNASGTNQPIELAQSLSAVSTQVKPASAAKADFHASVNFSVSNGTVSGNFDGNDPDIYSTFSNFMTENSMSSKDLSNAAYSGQALQISGDPQFTQTFSQSLDSLDAMASDTTSIAKTLVSWISQGRPSGGLIENESFSNMTDTQVIKVADDFIASADQQHATVSAIRSAFNNHTLTIENASQVNGLDYTMSYSGTESGGQGQLSSTSSINQQFIDNNPDGKKHSMLNFGDTSVYLTW